MHDHVHVVYSDRCTVYTFMFKRDTGWVKRQQGRLLVPSNQDSKNYMVIICFTEQRL